MRRVYLARRGTWRAGGKCMPHGSSLAIAGRFGGRGGLLHVKPVRRVAIAPGGLGMQPGIRRILALLAMSSQRDGVRFLTQEDKNRFFFQRARMMYNNITLFLFTRILFKTVH